MAATATIGRTISWGVFSMLRKTIVLASILAAFPAFADDFTLDYASIAASGKQMTLTRVPVVAPNGSVTYKDVTIRFTLGTGNSILVTQGYPWTVNSPALQTGNLAPGRYAVVDGTKRLVFRLTGPSIGQNNRATWSLASETGTMDITVYAGPITGHPFQARINAANIAESGGLFGLVTGRDSFLNANYFSTSALVTLAPSGSDLNLVSYSNVDTSKATSVDFSSPTATAHFFKCTLALCN